MTHETDPTKHLECYVSFDPAIDRAAMGRDFDAHFGATGERVSDIRYGTRDKALLRFVAGKRASVFVLRPLRAYERAQCDSLPTAESRWLRAISYALVRAEVAPPLSWKTEAIFPRESGDSRPSLDSDALDYLCECVSVEAVYEIGAVAYARSKLGPFVEGFAPLPATSVFVLARQSLSHADSPAPSTSGTSTTDAGST
jgi:hypothetical protein